MHGMHGIHLHVVNVAIHVYNYTKSIMQPESRTAIRTWFPRSVVLGTQKKVEWNRRETYRVQDCEMTWKNKMTRRHN